MNDPAPRGDDLFADLASFGADLARWPGDRGAPARAALLAQPEFRRAWEIERGFDRALAEARIAMDEVIADAGAAERVRRRTLAQLSAGARSGMPWQRIAAAMLIAGMLGGATDWMITQPTADPVDLAEFDPLDWPDDPASP